MMEPVSTDAFHLVCLSYDQFNMSKDGARTGKPKIWPKRLASLHPVLVTDITNHSQNSFQLFLTSYYRLSLWGCQELEDKMICLCVLDQNVPQLYCACILSQDL